jgi:hypothetical protein
MVDEDAPEGGRSQDAIEPLLAGIFLDSGESEERHAGNSREPILMSCGGKGKRICCPPSTPLPRKGTSWETCSTMY